MQNIRNRPVNPGRLRSGAEAVFFVMPALIPIPVAYLLDQSQL